MLNPDKDGIAQTKREPSTSRPSTAMAEQEYKSAIDQASRFSKHPFHEMRQIAHPWFISSVKCPLQTIVRSNMECYQEKTNDLVKAITKTMSQCQALQKIFDPINTLSNVTILGAGHLARLTKFYLQENATFPVHVRLVGRIPGKGIDANPFLCLHSSSQVLLIFAPPASVQHAFHAIESAFDDPNATIPKYIYVTGAGISSQALPRLWLGKEGCRNTSVGYSLFNRTIFIAHNPSEDERKLLLQNILKATFANVLTFEEDPRTWRPSNITPIARYVLRHVPLLFCFKNALLINS
jgi:hypothetical protein